MLCVHCTSLRMCAACFVSSSASSSSPLVARSQSGAMATVEIPNCSECGKLFVSWKSTADHMRRQHSYNQQMLLECGVATKYNEEQKDMRKSKREAKGWHMSPEEKACVAPSTTNSTK
eukprot:9551726-Alexandrium_andersonii.AAC.1